MDHLINGSDEEVSNSARQGQTSNITARCWNVRADLGVRPRGPGPYWKTAAIAQEATQVTGLYRAGVICRLPGIEWWRPLRRAGM